MADLPYLQQLTVLVPLYTDLLDAYAASEAARAAITPPARGWLAVAADITGAAR